jgi:hemerythrin-like domain-containing protein
MTAARASRRSVLLSAGGLAVGAGAVGAGATGAAWALTGSSAPARVPVSSAIPPDDDLMREHGVLKRVLLCYREMTGQIQAGKPVSAAHMRDSAQVIHDFIEGFHEGLEEGYVFPRVGSQRGGQLAGTVTTLLTQHARGRVITQFILTHTAAGQVASPGMKTRLAAAMRAFVRMYEPHEAREDTVIFPAFRQIVPPAELADLGRHFADLEHQQFGPDEFTAMVGRVTGIEEELGIYDLNQFTPEVTPYLPSA